MAGGFDLHDDRLAGVAATLAKAAPDAVFCVSDAATRAMELARPVPIVALSTDLVAAGLVRSLARPGGNITGVSILGSELNGKRLEILMQAVPSARRIAVLADPRVAPPAELKALDNAARARGIELVTFTAGAPEEIAPVMDKAKASGAAALNVLTAPLFSFNRRIVIERAAALGLPAIYEWPEMAEEGGLIGYGARLHLIYRQLARLLVKVLRGAKPEDLPVERPTNFELVINLTSAKALGLTIPEVVSGARRQGDRIAMEFAALREAEDGPSATSLDVCRLVAVGGKADIERTLPKDPAPDPCVLQVLRASISG